MGGGDHFLHREKKVQRLLDGQHLRVEADHLRLRMSGTRRVHMLNLRRGKNHTGSENHSLTFLSNVYDLLVTLFFMDIWNCVWKLSKRVIERWNGIPYGRKRIGLLRPQHPGE
jgi:hypothetical protein